MFPESTEHLSLTNDFSQVEQVQRDLATMLQANGVSLKHSKCPPGLDSDKSGEFAILVRSP
jgi:hypothetical protein